MKPLSEDEKERVFGDIIKSIAHVHQPAPGEFTLNDLYDALSDAGYDISKNKIQHRLYKLLDAEVVGKREIILGRSRTIVYFPIKDVSSDEMVNVLLDV